MSEDGGPRENPAREPPFSTCSLCQQIYPEDLAAALRVAHRRGAKHSEVYVEHRDSDTVRWDGGAPEARADRDVGAAVRVSAGGLVGYATTNVLTRAGLVAAAEAAAAIAAGTATNRPARVDLAERVVFPVQQPSQPGQAVNLASKAELARRTGASALEVDARVRQVVVTYVDVTQHVVVATSDGSLLRDARTRTRMTCRAVARSDGRVQAGFEGPGIGGGLELFDDEPPEDVGRAAAERAVRKLDGVDLDAGPMLVVLGQAGGGLFLHEACGHGLEADGLARDSSVYARTAGERLAAPRITAVDHPGRPGGFGSYAVDDEGRLSSPTVLIDEGVQTGALTDDATAGRLGVAPSANGRRESYAHPPLCRMSNTYIESGTDRAEDVIGDVRHGLYVARLSGGDVDIATGDFAFTTSEAYLIERGEVTRPVTGGTIIGNGPRALAATDAVCDDLAFTQSMCGKDGQWVPVSYGSPTLLIHGLRVTGG